MDNVARKRLIASRALLTGFFASEYGRIPGLSGEPSLLDEVVDSPWMTGNTISYTEASAGLHWRFAAARREVVLKSSFLGTIRLTATSRSITCQTGFLRR